MTKSGYFITIEGGEATGKTTQIQKLQSNFPDSNKYFFTREPGGTVFAEEMRDYIVTGARDKMSPISELLLLNAARYDHLQKLILPKLSQGINIICDRFLDSTIAYQSAARGVPIELVNNLHSLITNNFLPDLTIILDLDPEIAKERVALRAKDCDERFEKFPLEFHKTIRASFLKAGADKSRKVKIVDATQSAEEVLLEIIQAINLLS
jgi:dTMP kinase